MADSYLTEQEVADRLRISAYALRALRARTPRGVARPWRNVGGSGSGARYRWREDMIDAWLEEVTWHTSSDAETAGGSAGRSGTASAGPSDPRPTPPSGRPKTAAPKSRRNSESAATFDPAKYALSLVDSTR